MDTDWYEEDRPKIYDYIIKRFGKQRTAYILALGTMAAKNTIAVICKALCKMRNTDEYNLDKMEQIKYEYDNDPELTKIKYPEVFKYFDGLVDCVISQSQHPAGIVASPVNLPSYCGVFLGSDGQQILALDMNWCHKLGLIKYDILGLKTIGVIDKTCKMIGQYFPKSYKIDFADQAVFDDMANNPATIFQFESQFAADCFKQMHCTSIDDISIVTAAIRPGGTSYRDRILRKEVNDNDSIIINALLKESYGFLVYQEEITAFLQYICGFSGSDADSIRRAIGKKDAEKIAKAMPQILEGYCSKSDKPRDIAEQEAKKFLKVIEDSSSYMFNYNHALGYSLLSYLCGYYRHYYPVQYCTAYLTCAKNDDDIANGQQLAHSLGIVLENVKFRHAEWDYSCDPEKRVIYKGLSSIPYMSAKACEELQCLYGNSYNIKSQITLFDLMEEPKNEPQFTELLRDLKEASVDTRQIESLIKLDYFAEFGDINYLLGIMETYKKYKDRKSWFDKVSVAALSSPRGTTTGYDTIRYAFELTGLISTVIPNIADDYYFVTEVKGNLFTLYQLQTGKTVKYKIRKKTLEYLGMIKEEDIVKILEVRSEGKWYKDNYDKWVQSTENFEDVIKNFKKIEQDKN